MNKRRKLFLKKVSINQETGCWMWTAHINQASGYGQFWNGNELVGAHVFAYIEFKGPLPIGTEPDHLCRNRSCVCPDHLEAVTRRENLLRGNTIPAKKAAQTHCVNNHPLSGDNLIENKNGTRACRQCRSNRNRTWAINNRQRRREIDRKSYHHRKTRAQ